MIGLRQGTGAALTVLVLIGLGAPGSAQPAREAPEGERIAARITPEKPRTVIRPVDWEALEASLDDGGLFRVASLRSSGAQKFDDCRMPILLPTLDNLHITAAVYPQSHFYTAFINQEGYTNEIVGTRIAREFASRGSMARAMVGALGGDDDNVIITRTEYGLDLSLSRFGVAYSVSILCEKPDEDEHCTDEDYVRKLVKSLAYVGGQPSKTKAITAGKLWKEPEE